MVPGDPPNGRAGRSGPCVPVAGPFHNGLCGPVRLCARGGSTRLDIFSRGGFPTSSPRQSTLRQIRDTRILKLVGANPVQAICLIKRLLPVHPAGKVFALVSQGAAIFPQSALRLRWVLSMREGNFQTAGKTIRGDRGGGIRRGLNHTHKQPLGRAKQ